MSEFDRDKWNDRYRQGSYGSRSHPTDLLANWLPRLPHGNAFDVACGTGRNSLYLAKAGYDVDAVDISAVALEKLQARAHEAGLNVHGIEADLESTVLPDRRYDLIVLVRYASAALITRLLPLLKPGGCFLCEEHLQTDADVIGPSNSAFRVRPEELRELAGTLFEEYYREGIVIDPDGRSAALAQLIGRRT